MGPDGLRDLVVATLVEGVLSYVGVVELGVPSRPALLRRFDALRRGRPAVRCLLSAKWVDLELLWVAAGRRVARLAQCRNSIGQEVGKLALISAAGKVVK